MDELKYQDESEQTRMLYASYFTNLTNKFLNYIDSQMHLTTICCDDDFDEHRNTVIDSESTWLSELGALNCSSVFFIKEFPGWRFGIWWSFDKNTDTFKYEFFTQYSRFINKFKPCRSQLLATDYFSRRDADVILGNVKLVSEEPEGDWECPPEVYLEDYTFSIVKLLTYMKKYPSLAFYQDYYGVDLSRDHVSRTKAHLLKFSAIIKDSVEQRINQNCEKKIINKIKKELFQYLPTKAFIYDRGDSWSPRYELYIPLTAINGATSEDADETCGCYGTVDAVGYFKGEDNISECTDVINKLDHWVQKLINRKERFFRVFLMARFSIRYDTLNIYNDYEQEIPEDKKV